LCSVGEIGDAGFERARIEPDGGWIYVSMNYARLVNFAQDFTNAGQQFQTIYKGRSPLEEHFFKRSSIVIGNDNEFNPLKFFIGDGFKNTVAGNEIAKRMVTL